MRIAMEKSKKIRDDLSKSAKSAFSYDADQRIRNFLT